MSRPTALPCDHVHAVADASGLKGKALRVFIDEAREYAYKQESYANAEWRIGASRLKLWEEEVAHASLRKLAELLGRVEDLATAEGGAQ